jgi:hypothetical protein
MLDLNRVFKNDRLMPSFAGMNLAAFDQLLESFSSAYEAAHLLSAKRQPAKRQRGAPGGGRKANLQDMEDKLLYVLFYFKCYPIFNLVRSNSIYIVSFDGTNMLYKCLNSLFLYLSSKQ